jgi:hypothetical protein
VRVLLCPEVIHVLQHDLWIFVEQIVDTESDVVLAATGVPANEIEHVVSVGR